MKPSPLPWSKPFSCPKNLPSGWGTLESRRSYKCLSSFVHADSNERRSSVTEVDNGGLDHDEWGQFVSIAEDDEEQ